MEIQTYTEVQIIAHESSPSFKNYQLSDSLISFIVFPTPQIVRKQTQILWNFINKYFTIFFLKKDFEQKHFLSHVHTHYIYTHTQYSLISSIQSIHIFPNYMLNIFEQLVC